MLLSMLRPKLPPLPLLLALPPLLLLPKLLLPEFKLLLPMFPKSLKLLYSLKRLLLVPPLPEPFEVRGGTVEPAVFPFPAPDEVRPTVNMSCKNSSASPSTNDHGLVVDDDELDEEAEEDSDEDPVLIRPP